MARTKTPDFDRLDDIDVYIQSVPRSAEEEKHLHELLKKEIQKSRARVAKPRRSVPTPRKNARA